MSHSSRRNSSLISLIQINQTINELVVFELLNHIQSVSMRLIDLVVFGFIDSFHSVSLKEDYDEIINELCGTSVEAEITKAWNRFSDINSLKVSESNYWNHLDEFVKRQEVINHEWSRINEKINDIKNGKNR